MTNSKLASKSLILANFDFFGFFLKNLVFLANFGSLANFGFFFGFF
jgi:hypothetical protein